MTLLLFIVVLALLVLVHEWGHFFAARRFGIRVDEFGFGFPPRLVAKKFGETKYTINLFPLGGFVRIYGESGEGERDPRSFAAHPVWHRALIVAAGVLMNLVLAWVLFSAGAAIGTPALAEAGIAVENARVTITNIAEKSPAAEAHLTFGNVIYGARFQGKEIVFEKTGDLIEFTKAHRGEAITFLVLPSGTSDLKTIRDITMTPRLDPPKGEGPLGIGVADIGIARTPLYRAPWQGLKSLWFSLEATVDGFLGMIKTITTERAVPEGVSGPLGIFTLTAQTKRLGVLYFVQFMALLSVNLAVLNVLPIPALDGGRLLFLLVEKLRGRAMHFEYERVAHTIGFVLLLLLILFISIRDFQRFFS